jgi:iron complex transport system ATP-binding protein
MQGTAAAPLSARGLRVRLGARLVLDRVDFDVAAGQVVAICGPNGAGKSTLLRALLGLIPCESGEIRIGGHPLAELDARARARLVAYVPQRGGLLLPLRVDAVVAQGRYAHRGGLAGLSAQDRDAIAAAMDAADCQALATRAYSQLSAGEQQRVLLARALATEAPVVLFDEPTASLDIRHALEILALMPELARAGRSVVCVLHRLEEVLRVAQRVVLLDGGRVAVVGGAEDVLAAEHVRRVYGVRMEAAAAPAYHLIDEGGA